MADEANLAAVVEEISSILGWDSERAWREVRMESEHPGSHVRQAWESAAPQQPDEVESFYATTDAYILDLMVESAREVRQRWREAVTTMLDSWWGGADSALVLDYGGGVGSDTLWFAERCRGAAYYDLSGQTSDFAGERFLRRGAGVTRVQRTTNYHERYDALVSFETLEHLVDPMAHIDEMTRLVRTGGLLFLTESFDLVNEDYPAHLAANRSLAGQLDDQMRARGCHPVALLEGRIHVYAKGPDVTVIVPIYNAYDHVCRLLASMRATAPGYPIKWLLVNDASPDARISPLLQEFAASFEGAPVRIIDRKNNLGFPMTCNEAMTAAETDDVILLNSDTILYDGWAGKLLQGAYEHPNVATATPLSNNASAFTTFKHISTRNKINHTLGVAHLPLVQIPVGVGFCLFIKREALDRVGMFDPIFGKGYGEETDFCLRAAQAGYQHVLVPWAFVYHAGNASMLEANVVRAGETTVQEHERTIEKRYPTFVSSVHSFLASNTIERLNADLANRYIALESGRRPSIAAVVHDDVFSPVVGGTTDHLRDIVRELGSDFVFYFITPSPSEDSVVVTAYVDGVRQRITPYEAEYSGLLAELNPSLIHIHHLLNFNPSFIEALIAWNGPKFFTAHDYFAVCKQFTLLNYKGEYCNVPGPEECGRCAHALWGTNYDAVAARRAVFQRLVDSCSLVIAPSAMALKIFRKGILAPDAKAEVLPHPAVMQKYRDSLLDPFRRDLIKPKAVKVEADSDDAGDEAAHTAEADQFAAANESVWTAAQQRKARDAALRVGVLGYNSPQKGTMLVKGIIAACAHDPILFVSIGDVGQGAAGQPNVISTGRYDRMDVVELIESYKVDLIIVASIWPETFCYTVSESWMAGVPVLTGPLGAQAERVRATGAGIALDDLKVKTFVQALRDLAKDRARLDVMKRAAAQVVPATDYDAYRQRYLRTTGGVASMTHMFSAVWGQPPAGSQSLASVPLIAKLVGVRKRVFPVGSGREQLYFWLHDRVTSAYAGRLHG